MRQRVPIEIILLLALCSAPFIGQTIQVHDVDLRRTGVNDYEITAQIIFSDVTTHTGTMGSLALAVDGATVATKNFTLNIFAPNCMAGDCASLVICGDLTCDGEPMKGMFCGGGVIIGAMPTCVCATFITVKETFSAALVGPTAVVTAMASSGSFGAMAVPVPGTISPEATSNYGVCIQDFGGSLVGLTDPTNTDLSQCLGYEDGVCVTLTEGAYVEVALGIAVVDRPGFDLAIIADPSAPSAEPYTVAVSADALTWYAVLGNLRGHSAIDLGVVPALPLATEVRYVRVTDVNPAMVASSLGPKLDAVLAVNYVASASRYADGVVTSSAGIVGPPSNLLGPPDYWQNNSMGMASHGGVASLAMGEFAELHFSRVFVTDGPGADFVVREVGIGEGSALQVWVSDDGSTWIPISPYADVTPTTPYGAAPGDNFIAFDLASVALAQIDYVRLQTVISTPASDLNPGPDIDAIEALHWAAKPTVIGQVVPFVAGGSGGAIRVAAPASFASEPVFLAASLTPPAPIGTGTFVPGCSEIRLPLASTFLLFSGTLDSAAELFFTLTIPPSVVLPPVFLQALVLDPPSCEVSSVLKVVVQ